MGVLTRAVVGFDDSVFLGETKKAIGRQCQGTSFCSEGRMLQMKSAMIEVSSNTTAAKLGKKRN